MLVINETLCKWMDCMRIAHFTRVMNNSKASNRMNFAENQECEKLLRID